MAETPRGVGHILIEINSRPAWLAHIVHSIKSGEVNRLVSIAFKLGLLQSALGEKRLVCLVEGM
jgi:hypothetical protein